MELDNAILPKLSLHMEEEVEEEGAEGRPAAWLVTWGQPYPAVLGSSEKKTCRL